MKKLLLSLIAMLLVGTGQALAQTPTVYAEITRNGNDSNLKLTFKASATTPTYSSNSSGIGTYDLSSTPKYANLDQNTRYKITTAEFDNSVKDARPTSTLDWFYGLGGLTTITGLANLNTSAVTNMRRMFWACNALTSLDLSHFDTGNVTNMNMMFYNCGKLKSLDLSSFNTKKVTNMAYMFSYCSQLATLKLPTSFSTENVTNMNSMFNECRSLASLDLSSFVTTSKVTDMSYMFNECSSLKTLNLAKFNTSNVTNMSHMFFDCRNITSISNLNFDTEKVTQLDYMFQDCKKLSAIDLKTFRTPNVTTMAGMFMNCGALKSLDISMFTFNEDILTSVAFFAEDCTGLTSLNLGNNDFSVIANNSDAFKNVGFTKVKTRNVPICRLTRTFDYSSLGEASVILALEDSYAPYHVYFGGLFIVSDEIDCTKNYSPVARTVTIDLWQRSRNFKEGIWNSVVVPVALTGAQRAKAFGSSGVEYAKIDSYDGTTLKFKTISDDETIPANTPFLMKTVLAWPAAAYCGVDIVLPTNGKIEVSTTPVNGYYATFYGSYNYGAKLDRSCFYYHYQTGNFVRSAGNSFVDTTRGYFKFFNNGNPDTGNAKQFVLDDDGVATAIDAIDGVQTSETNAPAYNLSGQRVSDSYKGIVIVGGKKVLRK